MWYNNRAPPDKGGALLLLRGQQIFMWADIVQTGTLVALVTDQEFPNRTAWYVRTAAVASEGRWAAIAQGHNGNAIVIDNNGKVWDSGQVAFGAQPVAIAAIPDGWDVAWMQAPIGAHYACVRLSAATLQPMGAIISTAISGQTNTSQGILDMAADAPPLLVDQHRSIKIAGVTLGYPLTRGEWVVGQDWNVTPGVLAVHVPTQTVWDVWRGDTQTPSRAYLATDGKLWVNPANTAILIHDGEFKPYVPAPAASPPFVDEPEQQVPALDQANHPITVQVFGGPGFNMNLGTQHDWPDAPPSGAFLTLDRDGDAAFALQTTFATVHRVPFFQYIDNYHIPFTVDRVREVVGVEVVPTVCSYPGKSFAQVADEIANLSRRYPRVAVVVAGYRQMKGYGPEMNWRLADVLERARAVWQLIADNPRVKDVLVFHQKRSATNPQTGITNYDGLVSREELRQLVALMRIAAVPPPPPLVEQPAPLPEPTVPSEPEPPAESPVPEPIPPPPVVAVRPDKPIGGNAIADFFRAIAKLNVRKWLKDLFR